MNQSPSEKLFAHVDNCPRCVRWFVSHGLCPEGDAMLTEIAEETARAIAPMPMTPGQA